MCGRYSITTAPEALRRLFRFDDFPNLQPRWNVAPMQVAPVVRAVDGARRIDLVRWGLVPSWAKDDAGAARMINARSETVAEKPAFRAAFRARRCLVPADGFYEWRTMGHGKQPYRVTRADGAPFAFAGLWERWSPKDTADGELPQLETFTILTTEANEAIREIHHRMPVILADTDHEAWVSGTVDEAAALLRPLPAEATRAFPVSTRVGNVRNDDAELLAPIDLPEEAPAVAPPPRQGSLF